MKLIKCRSIGGMIGLGLLILLASQVEGQEYGTRLGVQRGGKVSFEPRGPGVLFGALDPAIKKWHIPQELFLEYQWRQWEYTNYAREPYQRYVNTSREGDYFYDFYGNFITRGWLIYDWRQDQPQQLGSSIFQNSRFGGWFNSVTISGDSKGQYEYAITIGNNIRSTLTPMTFSKPGFNGVQIDFAADKYAATILASRISEPIRGETAEPSTHTNATSLFGGRATVQVGDFIKIGGTLVDARNANTDLDLFSGDQIAGSLTTGQSSTPLNAMAVMLSDDSPEDGEGGAALFSHDVRIISRDFETGKETVFTLQEVVRPGAEWPIVFGGFRKSGFLAADGLERIILNYDFNDPAYIGPNPTSIIKVDFDYVLANDFRVEMWSDRQTGTRSMPAAPLTAEGIDATQPAFLVVRRAGGNVKDISNLQRVKFDYGLPTANLIGGFTIEGTQVWGFDFYGEWDRNKRYYQYPNAALFNAGKQHEIASISADAWVFNVSKEVYPWFSFGEGYSVDEAYSTSAYLVNATGDVQYDNAQRHFYEFVEDNDDQDRTPDWARYQQSSDTAVFPGWDENNDFIPDFNQNDNARVSNTIPDYEEPFLRYDVDRPEFLFGIDLNNNDWIDRFEDDDLPDLLYKPDRRGYNIFGGVHITPEARLTVGRTDERMLSTERENISNYAMFTLDKDYAGLGRLRVFDMFKRVKDSIPDDRRAPTANFDDVAALRPVVSDILPAPDTWINTAWIGFDYGAIEGLNVVNKLKYEIYHQTQDDPRDIDGHRLRGNASFFGLINKVDYLYGLNKLELQPKFKSEYLRRTPFQVKEEKRKQWIGAVQLLARLPVMKHSLLQAGIEQLWLRDLIADEDELVDLNQAGETGDLNITTVAVQLVNSSAYMGYQMTTQVGLRFGRTLTEMVQQNEAGEFKMKSESSNETTSFITVFAGIQ